MISFYLNHQAQVDEYVAAVEAQAEQMIKQIEVKHGSGGELRARLLARKSEREQTKK